MPLRRLTAVQFRRPMERGLNRPFLVLAQPDDGSERCPVVVKSWVGHADRPDAMLKELFSLLLARELGLTAPEPARHAEEIICNLEAGLNRFRTAERCCKPSESPQALPAQADAPPSAPNLLLHRFSPD